MSYKRIAVIAYHTCPLSDEKNAEIGGMNVYVLELSKELARKGCIVDIYTRSVNKNSPKIVNVSQNLRVIHLRGGEQAIFPKKQLEEYIPEFFTNIDKFIGEESITYDLVSCHYYLSGLIGLEIKRKYKIPMLITFHTIAIMKNLVARGKDEMENADRIKHEVLLTQKADKVIATSDIDKEYLNTLYNCPLDKISVLIPGINFELFKPIDKTKSKKIIKADLDHKLILFVGRIVPLKGIDMLFYAIKILIKQNPDLKFCLWIVGERSKEAERLEEVQKLLGITTYIRFVGMKRQEELPYYYNASEIVIMPSQYESFGIIALESMACGTPVITTDVTGISELFDKKHESLVTSAHNPILLSKKIKNLLMDENEHQKISHEVFEKVQDLGWDKVVGKFINILNNL